MLDKVNLKRKLTRKQYERDLPRLQALAHKLSYDAYEHKVAVVAVFEGWDAAGKGGAIKRLTEKLDPRGYVVWPIAAPQGEDREKHYLYRFWRRLPEAGQLAIFDRSWYGRVLVERVEGFCAAEDWQRAYAEINHFERQLADHGMLVLKFWLHLGQDEQLRRFGERDASGYKSWKLTDEDWRNRDKWEDYEQAVNDVLVKTSTPAAPWTIVEANDKLHARIKVLSTFTARLKQALK